MAKSCTSVFIGLATVKLVFSSSDAYALGPLGCIVYCFYCFIVIQ